MLASRWLAEAWCCCKAEYGDFFFRRGLCFMSFVQALPSWAEQEVCGGSVLGLPSEHPRASSWLGRAHLVRLTVKRRAKINKPKGLLPRSSSLWRVKKFIKQVCCGRLGNRQPRQQGEGR